MMLCMLLLCLVDGKMLIKKKTFRKEFVLMLRGGGRYFLSRLDSRPISRRGAVTSRAPSEGCR